MKKRLGLTLLAIISIVPALTLFSGQAAADVNDFEVTNFNGDYYLSKASPHGQLDITENISVNYQDYNHGILRAIPESYKSHPLDLKIDSVSSSDAPAQYTTYKDSGNTVLKIGNPDQTVTGDHSYTLKYSVQNVITFYSDHDELFWDINGDQWSQNFDQVEAHFHIPDSIAANLQKRMVCYAGIFGSISQNCQLKSMQANGEHIITATATNLPANSTLSVVLAFNKGTFVPYGFSDWLNWHRVDIALSIIALVILALAFRQWWIKGKDPRGTGVIVPQYGPPKGVSVLDAGLLQDYHLDNKDITAVIIDLAVRGYITIVESDKKVLLFKSVTTTSLNLNKTTGADLKDYEKTLLQALFDDFTPGSILVLGKYQSGMATAIRSIGKASKDRLTKEGLFDSDPAKPTYGLLILYLTSSPLLAIIALKNQAYLALGLFIVTTIVIIILIAHMPRRSKQGALYNEDLKGLKLYLKTAEADRIKFTQGPNAKYAENAHEPVRTVNLFEKLLPFAIIFGVEKDWAKQFEGILTEPPDWYQGNWATFNALALTNSIDNATAAMGTTFSPPSSSSGSGFSGGGAGGGGGGGGGGGW